MIFEFLSLKHKITYIVSICNDYIKDKYKRNKYNANTRNIILS